MNAFQDIRSTTPLNITELEVTQKLVRLRIIKRCSSHYPTNELQMLKTEAARSIHY